MSARSHQAALRRTRLIVGLLLLAVSAACSEGGEDGATAQRAGTAADTAHGGAPAAREPGGRNLVLVTLDTTRADALGAYGQTRAVSPNLDRMAAEGVLFEQVATSNPETLPSHSTLFTSKLPYAHGVRANAGFVLSKSHLTLAEHLRAHGYRTAAEVAAPVLRRETQVTQGFDGYRDPESHDVKLKTIRFNRDDLEPQTRKIRVGADITDKGIAFMRRHRNDRFFLWLHYFDAHHPYSAPGKYNARIPDSPYHAEVAYQDDHFGRLLDEIERLGLRDRTLVVVTADHGEGLNEHGEPSHSFLVYETVIHVPLLLWGLPELPAGLRVASLVRTVDVAPTALELIGQPPLPDAQGVSLVPLIEGRERDLGVAAYGEATRFSATFGLPTLRFLRVGRWKYIHKVNPELYDVLADPGEQNDLAADHPEIVERLRARMEAMLAEAPAGPDDAEVALDAATAAELMALGYVARAPAPDVSSGKESLELHGADPMTRLDDIVATSKVYHFLEIGLYQEAYDVIAPVVERNPRSAYALVAMADALTGLERHDEAVAALEKVVELDTRDQASRHKLATSFHRVGRSQEAVALLRELIGDAPCREVYRSDQGRILHELGAWDEMVALLADGAERCPDMISNLNNYAWALATLPRDDLRDGELAVRVIRDAIARSPEPDPAHQDTLAAALAEAGRYDEAASTARSLLRELRADGAPEEILVQIESHLQAFREGRAVRDPATEAG